MSYLIPALGTAVALAGSDKLSSANPYDGLFRHLGWSTDAMQLVAAAEVAGGLLMIPRRTRGIGSALVIAASAAVLGSELSHGDQKQAVPRGLIMIASLLALVSDAVTPRHKRIGA